MALRRLLEVFSQMMVKTYDLDWLRDIFTDQVMQRHVEITQQKGIIQASGADFVGTEAAGDVEIGVGRGYIDGERVEIESVETVALAEGEDVVISIAHATEADADAHATRLDDIGGSHTVWYRDGYLIEKTAYATWIAAPPDAKLALWRAQKTAGVVTLTDMRVWLTLGLPVPDSSISTANLANAAVTAAKIANYNVTRSKIALLAINEGLLDADTEIIPLAACRKEETAAGSSISLPSAYATYAAAIGGGYEYKILGRIYRAAFAGPIRRLRLLATADSAATSGTAKVYLVAWVDEPANYDPDDPSYDGEVAYQEITPPGGGADIDIELDDIPAFEAGKYTLTYGLVMRNDLDATLNLTRVVLVALR